MEAPWPAPAGSPLIEPSAARRRRPWLVIVAVVAVLAVAGGVVAVAATRGGDEPQARPADLALRAAVDSLHTKPFVTYTLVVESLGERLEANGVHDAASGIFEMTLRGMGLPGGARAVFDTKGNRMYLEMGALSVFPTDADWVVFDLTALAEMGGASSPLPDEGWLGSPLDVSRLLAMASTVREVGVESVGGERLRRLEVTLDASDVAGTPDDVLDQLPPDYRDLVDALPKALTFDVWVTDADELRRMSFEMPAVAGVAAGSVSVDMTITPTADAVPPTLPPSADTVDILDLLGSFGLGDLLDEAFSG